MEIFSGKYKKYWNEELPEGRPMGPTRVEGAPTPLGRALVPCGTPVGPLTCFDANLSYKSPNLQKYNLDQEFHRRKPL